MVELAEVPISAIRERENHSREYYGDLGTLADAILASDWVAPVIVLREPKSRFGLVAGYRRLRACRLLIERGDWPADKAIPAQVYRKLDEAAAAALNGAENQQRLDPNQAELFKLCWELKSRFGFTSEEVGIRLGKSPKLVNNFARCHTSLHPTILAALARGARAPLAYLIELAAKPRDVQLKLWLSSKAGKNSDPLVEAPEEPRDAKPVMRRRRELENAIKQLRKVGTEQARFGAACLRWALGELSEPWE